MDDNMEDELEVSAPRYTPSRHQQPLQGNNSAVSLNNNSGNHTSSFSDGNGSNTTANTTAIAIQSRAGLQNLTEESEVGSMESHASSLSDIEFFKSSSESRFNMKGIREDPSMRSVSMNAISNRQKNEERSYSTLNWLWSAMTGGARDAEPEEQDEFPPTEQQLPKVEDLDYLTMQTEKKSTFSQHNQPRKEKDLPTELPEESNPVAAIMLALWDNVKGPTVEKIWETNQKLSNELFQHLSRHTLSDEILRPYSDSIETKFYVLGDYAVISASFVFTSIVNHNKYSLSILASLSTMSRFLELYPIIQDRVPIILSRFRVVQPKPYGIERLSKMLVPFIIDIQELEHLSIPVDIMVKDTIFSNENQHIFEPSFIRRAITSHIQTHGISIVIGTDLNLINMMVRSLGLFLTESERKRSRLAAENTNYMPDLVVQGILIKGDMSEQLADHNVIESKFPTTLIDITNVTVQQTSDFQEYTLQRNDYLLQELKELPDSSSYWVSPNGMFRMVKESAPFVNKLVTELFQLPFALRTAYIHESVRLLNRKAIALIKYTEIELENQRRSSIKEAILTSQSLRKIRQDLSLNDNNLFFAVLATAEKLKEGTFKTVIGDPHTMEEKFREMIESF